MPLVGTVIDVALPIQEWLRACESLHKGTCDQSSTTPTQSRRPSRLIDVQNQCIAPGTGQDDYLALSYTWQQTERIADDGVAVKEDMQLCTENIVSLSSAHGLRKEYSQLPKVIRDAMELTAALGKRYLWVDRLCILQDDPQKTLEFMYMDEIYSGAYMTIVAAARNGIYYAPEGICHCSGWRRKLSLDEEIIKDHYDRLSETRWAKRAWTYQEHILSKRVVFFLDDRTFWQCECSVWDDDKKLRPYHPSNDAIVDTPDFSALMTQLKAPKWPDFDLYADLICPYNGRELSHVEDGLSACLIILHRLEPSFPNGFLFGMPRLYFDYALLWQPLNGHYERSEPLQDTRRVFTATNRRPTLPSWAWCGWQCFIDPQSFQAALELSKTILSSTETMRSWKLHNIVTWESSGHLVEEPMLAELVKRSGNHTLETLSESWQHIPRSIFSPTSNHISGSVAHAGFQAASILEIRIVPSPYVADPYPVEPCTSIMKASVNPVLTKAPLHKMPKVIVLQDSAKRYSGLLRVTGNSRCKKGEKIELIAISRGTASGRDLKLCFEEKVFLRSRYQDPRGFFPHYDNDGHWDGFESDPEGDPDFLQVVAVGECEETLASSEGVTLGKARESRARKSRASKTKRSYHTDTPPECFYKDNQTYEFYNVLWVQRQDESEVWSRAGCGRVFAHCWDENNPVMKSTILG